MTKKCYYMNGDEMASSFAPCNPDSAVSPCCEMFKANPDVCTDTGLCLAQQDGFEGNLYQNGCTDKSWEDNACPHFCKYNSSIRSMDVLQCGRGKFCCTKYFSGEDCCADESSIMTTPMGKLQVTALKTATVAPPTSTPTVESCPSCPKDNTAVVGGAVGGALGAALLVALVALAFVLRKRRKDGQTLEYKSVPVTSQYGYSQSPPSSHPAQELPVQ